MSTNIDGILSQQQQQSSAVDLQTAFMQKVYAWMMGGLLVTAFFAYLAISFEPLLLLVANSLWFFFIAELGLVWWLSARVARMQYVTAVIAFLGYSALNGLTLSIIAFAYTASSITTAFMISATMFGAMSVYGLVTKRDLTSMGSFFVMGLFGLLAAILVNLFLQSSALSFAISVVGVLVFVGLTAYDTWKIKNAYAVQMENGEMAAKFSIISALTLYLDFINLFLFILRLLGRRN